MSFPHAQPQQFYAVPGHQPYYPQQPARPPVQWQGNPKPQASRPIRQAIRRPMKKPMAKRQDVPLLTFRMQSPDPEPAPSKLVLPAPENLGLTAAVANVVAKLDWNNVRARLKTMNAVGFRLANLDDGQVRVTFIFPSRQANRHCQIEVTAVNETEAVTTALARAENWIRQAN